MANYLPEIASIKVTGYLGDSGMVQNIYTGEQCTLVGFDGEGSTLTLSEYSSINSCQTGYIEIDSAARYVIEVDLDLDLAESGYYGDVLIYTVQIRCYDSKGDYSETLDEDPTIIGSKLKLSGIRLPSGTSKVKVKVIVSTGGTYTYLPLENNMNYLGFSVHNGGVIGSKPLVNSGSTPILQQSDYYPGDIAIWKTSVGVDLDNVKYARYSISGGFGSSSNYTNAGISVGGGTLYLEIYDAKYILVYKYNNVEVLTRSMPLGDNIAQFRLKDSQLSSLMGTSWETDYRSRYVYVGTTQYIIIYPGAESDDDNWNPSGIIKYVLPRMNVSNFMVSLIRDKVVQKGSIKLLETTGSESVVVTFPKSFYKKPTIILNPTNLHQLITASSSKATITLAAHDSTYLHWTAWVD